MLTPAFRLDGTLVSSTERGTLAVPGTFFLFFPCEAGGGQFFSINASRVESLEPPQVLTPAFRWGWT